MFQHEIHESGAVLGSSNSLYRSHSRIRMPAACLAIAMVIAACSGSSGDDIAATTTPPIEARSSGTAVGTDSGMFAVRVQHQIDEATADEALTVLAANGFNDFVKEKSAGDGFSVVAHGLTEDDAASLIVRLTTDASVPYTGVVFPEG